jgi:hypothetical protein
MLRRPSIDLFRRERTYLHASELVDRLSHIHNTQPFFKAQNAKVLFGTLAI